MKNLWRFPFFAVVFILFGCKTGQPVDPGKGGTRSLSDVVSVLDTTYKKFVDFSNETNGDLGGAVALTAHWLAKLPAVSDATALDGACIRIDLKSGLRTMFIIDEINDDSLTGKRGGGARSGNRLAEIAKKSVKTITNKKVLFYIPPFRQFYKSADLFSEKLAQLENSGLGLDVKALVGADAGHQVIETFGDYGLVIIDTHGWEDEFQTGSNFSWLTLDGSVKSEDFIKGVFESEAGTGTYQKCLDDKLYVGRHESINTFKTDWQKKLAYNKREYFLLMATSKYIKSLPSLSNTIIFGNMCNSGWDLSSYTYPPSTVHMGGGKDSVYPAKTVTFDPIREAFLDRGPLVYYCYSHNDGSSGQVSEPFAQAMEDSLINHLTQNRDSTGAANLRPDGKTEFYDNHPLSDQNLFMRRFGADNYSYGNCIDTFTDSRDGQVYKAVCIGEQIWMAQNLNYNAPGSNCYDDALTNCKTYGKLYDWTTVMQGAASTEAVPSNVQGICPKGWHVPSIGECNKLIAFVGGTDVASGALKSVSSLWASPNVGATNSSGFSALPAGEGSPFTNLGKVSRIWTTSDYAAIANFRMTLYLTSDDKETTDANPKTGIASCRCVKDP